jgi:hypothetical protein
LRLQIFFGGLYTGLDEGASSHGGRQTSVTGLPKRSSRPVVVFEIVQQRAERASLSTTQRHIGQQGRQPQGRCDIVTQCRFAAHMVASRPASQVHDISARRKSKAGHLLI